MKNGLLLINLGTPKRPDVSAVRSYLYEFLRDKRVIDIPAPLRYFLLFAFILPFRSKKSAHAYKLIWTSEGSPLLINSQRFLAKLQARLGDNYQVALGMRYGEPSITSALQKLSHCDKLTILPLFPQYSFAATGSAIAKVLTLIAEQNTHPSLTIIRYFYQHEGFIAAQAELIRPYLVDHDYVLFSYHGVPERHVTRGPCRTICEQQCPPVSTHNHLCYRAQCYQTSSKLAEALGLGKDKYSVAFQSRLGAAPWIKPYTDLVLPELARRGIKRLAISCPSFVADCLETLEEIGIRARKTWHESGGEQLTLVPCVNDSERWVDGVIDICELTQYSTIQKIVS